MLITINFVDIIGIAITLIVAIIFVIRLIIEKIKTKRK